MEKTTYEKVTAERPEHPPRDLLRVRNPNVILSADFFGLSSYNNNVAEMRGDFSHPQTGERISFRPATTQETLIHAAYDPAQTKAEVLDPNWLQLGRIVRTQEGVFTNTQETDQDALKTLLNGARKTRGIYLLANDVAFIPYDSFETGVQEAGDFIEGGLARGLEHTRGKVSNLAKISDPSLYKLGVNVWGFEPTQAPTSRVASLYSGRYSVGVRLYVGGDGWLGYSLGFASGVLNNAGEASARAK